MEIEAALKSAKTTLRDIDDAILKIKAENCDPNHYAEFKLYELNGTSR